MVAFYGSAYPNTFVDVSAYWPAKLEAIKKHETQFTPEMYELFCAFLAFKARELAEGRGFELAEAFKVLTLTHLHFFEHAWQC